MKEKKNTQQPIQTQQRRKIEGKRIFIFRNASANIYFRIKHLLLIMKYNLQVYLPFALASVQGVDLRLCLLVGAFAFSANRTCTEVCRVRKVIAVANVSI